VSFVKHFVPFVVKFLPRRTRRKKYTKNTKTKTVHVKFTMTLKKYISILRGINVSGSKMIKMEELRKLYEGMKFKNVTIYIQSGNVIFENKPADTKELQKQIEKKILKVFGYEVPVIVKEKEEVINVIKNNPFVNRKRIDITKLHVTFLAEEPEPAHIDKIKDLKYDPDEFIISGDAIYLFCPNGYGNTKLNNNYFESKLKVTATTRNWKTVNELVRITEVMSL
jgi:uncharacterized protein (DUF1697 family)